MLELHLLGELEAFRDGQRVPLPPSRKTRALLGYLIATARPHRRERLCSIFWEIPDDPRGSLRWSMSRLRSIVDEEGLERISADRETVAFAPGDAQIDLAMLQQAAARGFENLSTELLQQVARSFRGEFLEGLELPNQHEFQAWCLAQREDLRRVQIKLLRALFDRLKGEPEAAIAPLRQLVQIDPYDEAARIDLLRTLIAAGREQEAERQFAIAERQFSEIGPDSVAHLTRQWRGLRTKAAAAPPAVEPAVPAASEPINASLRSTAALPAAGWQELVGREREFKRLASAVGAAIRLREPGVTVVLGEPGMGKSRLLAEIRNHAHALGARVHFGRAYDGAPGAAYTPWLEALGKLPDLGSVDSLAAGRQQFFGAVIDEVLSDTTRPAVLAFDDMHWSDEASADLLHQLVRSARGLPLSVIISVREGELPDNTAMSGVLRSLRHDGLVDELILGPLKTEDARTLVRSITTGERVERIADLSGGNPLFAIELARDLSLNEGALPTSLKGLLRERLDRLPQNAAELVRWAAVLGRSFPVTRLQAIGVLPEEELLDALDMTERHGLLRPSSEESYAFSHDLVRRAVLSTLSAPRRKLMHLRAAETLQRLQGEDAPPFELANHAAQGGNYALATSACIAAARRALRVFAHAEALALVRSGAHYAASLPDGERLGRLVELAELEVAASQGAEREALIGKIDRLAEAALDAGRPELASRCYTTLAYLRWQGGEWQGAKRDTLQAEFFSRLSKPDERVVAMAEAARCLAMLERDMEQAEALLLEAEALSRRLSIEPNAIADARGLLKAFGGAYAEAEGLFRHAREIARRDGERLNEFLVLEHLLTLQIALGRIDECNRLSGELIELAQKLRPGSELAFSEAIAAICALALGQDDSETRVEAALDTLRKADAKHRLSVAATFAARVFMEKGRIGMALAAARDALGNAEILERVSDIADALAALVEIAAGGQLLPDGDGYLQRLDELSAMPISAAARAAREHALMVSNHAPPERH